MKSSRGTSGHQSIRIHKAKRFHNDYSKGYKDKDMDDFETVNPDKRVHTDFFNNFKDDFDLEDWK